MIKKILCATACAAGLLLPSAIEAKIFIIVDRAYYLVGAAKVDLFADDIRRYDHKSVEVIPWTVPTTGTNYDQCLAVRNYLRDNASMYYSDRLEGAVLIGSIPVPQTWSDIMKFEPFDYFYMDFWNYQDSSSYNNLGPFSLDAAKPGYFSNKYNTAAGDSKLDIWVSRVFGRQIAAFCHLRSSASGTSTSTILDEKGIYDQYLDRLHKRYTEPAAVPSRAFAMGGTGDNNSSLADALDLDLLNLPMYVEFNGGAVLNDGQASAFNFMSQLQLGPRGGQTVGAYNNTIFPTERNARNCTYTSLKDARSYAPYSNRTYSSLNNTGWEWAGVYTHSNPWSFEFNFVDMVTHNGSFSAATQGPFWGNAMRRTGGYVPPSGNSSGYYFYYNCNNITPDPYGFEIWRGKSATFKYPVVSTGTYNIYLYYADAPTNCSNGIVKLYENKVNASGYPMSEVETQRPAYALNQRVHVSRDGSTNWECIFYGVRLTAGNLVTIILDANGQDGEVRADAVRFVCNSPVVDAKVDNVEPTTNAAGPAIFKTKGFYTNDWVNRSFHSMQDESGSTHNRFSKVPFFLSQTCGTNNFLAVQGTTSMDNLGSLLAFGHNGLISMGVATNAYAGIGYSDFTRSLAGGSSFGEAFLEQANVNFKLSSSGTLDLNYVLLGAGSLRSIPYVQYGAALEQNKTVSSAYTKNATTPVLIRGVTVNSGISYTVSSTVTTTGVNCAKSEIVIRPETWFKYGSKISIKAN